MTAAETVKVLSGKGFSPLQVVHSARASRAIARTKYLGWDQTVRLAETRLAVAYAGGLPCHAECMNNFKPVAKCRCSCKGVNHGKSVQGTAGRHLRMAVDELMRLRQAS